MIYADLHMHGKYSRAVSSSMTIPVLEKYARIKGLNLLGTGDAQHPKWREHLEDHLVKNKDGIFFTKSGFAFMLTTEISLIYTDATGRRVHVLVFFPSLKSLDAFTKYLLSKGRIDYDGRPIFKISCEQFAHDVMGIDNLIEIIPAHIWTPWFGLLGEHSKYDSVISCFKSQEKHIHALETGISSDPLMNFMLSTLDKYTLLSSSDAHSYHPWRIGREATLFDTQLSYPKIIRALRTREGYAGTIEADPAYGKYHFDGHRNCKVSLSPEESQKLGNICPVCKKKLTIGVLHRVAELADRPLGFMPTNAAPFCSLLPLHELLSFSLKKGLATRSVEKMYQELRTFGDEFFVLLQAEEKQLSKLAGSKITELIMKNRKGTLTINPGYDGVYGTILDSAQTLS